MLRTEEILKRKPTAVDFKRPSDKMGALGFDPIEQMVAVAEKLALEIKRWEDIAEGRMLKPNGEPFKYSPMYHMKALEQYQVIAAKLLEYGYVKPTIGTESAQNIPQIVVHLTKE